ncbi:outer membrane beta-barrel protein [Novosphingobium sp. BW1]|uniref:outer membrane beta-barrel protein n=1 Tax=Novosphingobium sp. BW1 TaxID=2592621 RepID=UPI0013969169|nr:outer membrane beta-barrel protein [Novosphingobium sp. BW1]
MTACPASSERIEGTRRTAASAEVGPAVTGRWGWWIGGASLALGGVAMPVGVQAQSLGAGWALDGTPSLDRPGVAGNRIEPGFEATPLHVGSFLLEPRISAIWGYDGNVFNEPDARRDAALVVAPRLNVALDDSRHRVNVVLSGRLRRFALTGTENSDAYGARGNGGFALGPNVQFDVTLEAARQIEPRSSSGAAINAREPVSYHGLGGDAGLQFDLGRLRLSARAGYRRVSYNDLDLRDGDTRDQSFRDTQAVSADLRIAYDLSGFLSTFVQARGDTRHSFRAAPEQARDSRGGAITAGIKGEIMPLVSLEVSAGYQVRDYDNPDFRDFQGVGFALEGEWYTTPLLTMQLRAERRFRNSGNREVAGILADTLTATVFYDPTRRLRLSFAGEVARDNYRDVSTRARRVRADLQVQYRINRHVALAGQIYWRDQHVTGTPLVNAFTAFGAGLGLTITP